MDVDTSVNDLVSSLFNFSVQFQFSPWFSNQIAVYDQTLFWRRCRWRHFIRRECLFNQEGIYHCCRHAAFSSCCCLWERRVSPPTPEGPQSRWVCPTLVWATAEPKWPGRTMKPQLDLVRVQCNGHAEYISELWMFSVARVVFKTTAVMFKLATWSGCDVLQLQYLTNMDGLDPFLSYRLVKRFFMLQN